MHSLQILDAGETFLRTLDPRPHVLGTAAGADIQLSGEGLRETHARLSPEGGAWRIESLSGEADLLVNGEARTAADLQLGDRVELGTSVLVLGKQVPRPATAKDVLQRQEGARHRGPQKRASSGRGAFVTVVAIAVMSVGALAWWAREEAQRRFPEVEAEQIKVARKRGDFDEALQVIRRLEATWAEARPERLRQLGDAKQQVLETQAAFDELYTEMMARVGQASYLEQLKKIQQLRKSGNRVVAEAANLLSSNLKEYRLQALSELRESALRVGVQVPESKPEAPVPVDVPDWFAARKQQVEEHLQNKEYMAGMDLCRASFAALPDAQAKEMVGLLHDLREAARAEARELTAKAFALEQSGEVHAAVALLQRHAHRYPRRGELSLLRRELERYEAQAGIQGLSEEQLAARRPKRAAPVPAKPVQPPKSQPQPQPQPEAGEVGNLDTEPGPELDLRPKKTGMGRLDRSAIRKTEAEVASLLQQGELKAAIEQLETAAEDFAGNEDRLNRYLLSRAADLRLVERAITAALNSGRKPSSLPLDFGRQSAWLLGLEGMLVKVKLDKEEREFAWTSLPFAAAAKLAEVYKLSASDSLGIVVLGYLADEQAEAEKLLVKLLGRDPQIKPQLTALISRGRGEVVDERGYVLVDGRFVARRFVAVSALAKKFERELARVLKKDEAARDEVLGQLRASGEEGAEDALILAFKRQLDEALRRLQRHPVRRRLDELEEKRQALDAARTHAKALIYDTKTYFYPYKPPAVSGARHSEYQKVQKEVDIRVAAVRKLWLDKSSYKLAASLREQVGGALWMGAQLEAMSELAPAGSQRLAWLRAIPPVANLNLRNFCRSEAEVRRLREWMDIEIYNEEIEEHLKPGEIDQLRITNSYRLMFGHRPLAMNLKAHKAAQGHAEEMAELGYFSHRSPTPGRSTPYDRMRLADYNDGISENIAGNPSAAGAHYGWTHSSGHHRNLLHPAHTEVGIGNSGRLWVQNFGRGSGYREHEAFPR